LPGSLGGLDAPTNNPNEPITAGVGMGPGPGPVPPNPDQPTQRDAAKIKSWLPVLRQYASRVDTSDQFRAMVDYMTNFDAQGRPR
jgi:hypothetical protein